MRTLVCCALLLLVLENCNILWWVVFTEFALAWLVDFKVALSFFCHPRSKLVVYFPSNFFRQRLSAISQQCLPRFFFSVFPHFFSLVLHFCTNQPTEPYEYY
jgi:hypothetical protein